METEEQRKRILNENPWKILIDFSWPAVLAMFLLGANNVLDGIFVGHFAEPDSLAGISIALPAVIILVGFGLLIGTGAGSLLSIAIGAGDTDIRQKLLGNVNTLAVLTSLAVMLLGLAFSHQLLFAMGGRDNSLALGESYYRTLLWGAPLWIYSVALNSLIRAEGNMKTSAVIMAIGLVTNGISNYVLMVLLGQGIKGAAIGTNIGMAVQSLIGMLYMGYSSLARERKGYPSAEKPSILLWKVCAIRFDRRIVAKMIPMGLSAFIMQIMMVLQSMLVLNVITRYGTAHDTAFYGIVIRLFSFVVQPLAGFMIAMPPIIGINFGAAQSERVIRFFKCFLTAALIFVLPFWFFMLTVPKMAAGLMMNSAEISAENIIQFRVYMALLPVMPISFLALGFFPAINKGNVSSILALLQQVVLYVPIMLLLPFFSGVHGVYYGTLIIELVTGIPILILIRREFGLLRTGATKWQTGAAESLSLHIGSDKRSAEQPENGVD